MTSLLPPIAYYYGGGGIGHMIVSAVIHGLIYNIIFRLLAHLSLGQAVLLVVIVVGGIWLWNRQQRGAGGW